MFNSTKLKVLLTFSFVFMVVCLIGVGVATSYFLTQPIWQASQSQRVDINFKKGMSLNQLVPLLSKEKELVCPFCLKLYFRLLPSSLTFKAGIYQLSDDITPQRLVDILHNGDVLTQKITITEGQLSKQLIAQLDAEKYILYIASEVSAFSKTCSLCKMDPQHVSLEGMFLADTYFFPAGIKAKSVLRRAHKSLVSELKRIWETRATSLPYQTPKQLLIAASIIEKETASSDEKKLVSAVIVNRLKKGMRLQMDPTVIYALGDNYRYPLTKQDLKVDNPFNTYKYKGLPPTPIANVGLEALYAAAHPANVNYLYFVAMSDGHHQFSETLAQQIQAIKTKQESL